MRWRRTVTPADALDELGLEPSPELRSLERRVLEHDPALAREPELPAEPSLRVVRRS